MVWPDFVQDRLGFLAKEKYIREVGKKGRRSDGPPFRGRSRAGRAVWIGSTPDLTPPPFLLFLFRRCHLPPRHLPPTVADACRHVPAAARRRSRESSRQRRLASLFPSGRSLAYAGGAATACCSSRLAASEQQCTIGLATWASGNVA